MLPFSLYKNLLYQVETGDSASAVSADRRAERRGMGTVETTRWLVLRTAEAEWLSMPRPSDHPSDHCRGRPGH